MVLGGCHGQHRHQDEGGYPCTSLCCFINRVDGEQTFWQLLGKSPLSLPPVHVCMPIWENRHTHTHLPCHLYKQYPFPRMAAWNGNGVGFRDRAPSLSSWTRQLPQVSPFLCQRKITRTHWGSLKDEVKDPALTASSVWHMLRYMNATR